MAIDNKQIARRLFEEVWNRGKLDQLDSLLADGFKAHDPLMGVLNKAAYRETTKGYLAAFPDLKFEIDAMFSDGNTVITRWTAKGTHKGTFLKVAPTGIACVVGGISIGEFEDGKLLVNHTQMDALGLMRQLGVSATPEVTAARKPSTEAVARH